MAIYKRKTFRRKVYTKKPKSLAVKAYRMAKAIRRSYKPEVKKLDLEQTTYNAGTTAGVIPINRMGQGDTTITRNGNKILCRYVTAKGWVQHNNTATIGQLVKVWLVLDKQQVGDTSPTAANLFSIASSSITSPLNNDSVGRFKILWSKVYVVDPSNEIKPVNLFKRINIPTRFNGVNAGDIQKNGLYIFYASSDNVNNPTLTIDTRTAYIDN